jgi:hypothetical protein
MGRSALKMRVDSGFEQHIQSMSLSFRSSESFNEGHVPMAAPLAQQFVRGRKLLRHK